MNIHQDLQNKYIIWKNEYSDLYTWEEFNEQYQWCFNCDSYQEGQCVCYAR